MTLLTAAEGHHCWSCKAECHNLVCRQLPAQSHRLLRHNILSKQDMVPHTQSHRQIGALPQRLPSELCSTLPSMHSMCCVPSACAQPLSDTNSNSCQGPTIHRGCDKSACSQDLYGDWFYPLDPADNRAAQQLHSSHIQQTERKEKKRKENALPSGDSIRNSFRLRHSTQHCRHTAPAQI